MEPTGPDSTTSRILLKKDAQGNVECNVSRPHDSVFSYACSTLVVSRIHKELLTVQRSRVRKEVLQMAVGVEALWQLGQAWS